MYVILVERGGYVFPVLYALLMNKSQQTYQQLFAMIKNVWPAFNPKNVLVDFEMAAITALEISFPNTEIWGCFFHLVQNLKKQLAIHHLKARYDTDADFAMKCRKPVIV